MIYFSTTKKEECKKLSNEDQMGNLIISDIPKTTESSEKVVKEGALSLTHSPAGYVFTNDDLEDIDSSSCNGSESV